MLKHKSACITPSYLSPAVPGSTLFTRHRHGSATLSAGATFTSDWLRHPAVSCRKMLKKEVRNALEFQLPQIKGEETGDSQE